MAKKKAARKNKSNNNLTLVLFIVAIVTILYLARQVQDKDKQLKKIYNSVHVEKTENKQPENPANVIKKSFFTKEQETEVRRQIKDNLEAMIGRKPKMADKWFLSDIKFKDEGMVTFIYEDGHEAGEVTMRISDPSNYTTWQRTGSK